MSDISILTRAANIYWFIKRSHFRDFKLVVVTVDDDLDSWLNCFILNNVSQKLVSQKTYSTKIDFTIDWETLFYKLSDKKKEQLQKKVFESPSTPLIFTEVIARA